MSLLVLRDGHLLGVVAEALHEVYIGGGQVGQLPREKQSLISCQGQLGHLPYLFLESLSEALRINGLTSIDEAELPVGTRIQLGVSVARRELI